MRQAKCKRCGIVFMAVGTQTYCETCRTEIKRQSVLRPRTCLQCGVTFDGDPRSRYCPDCAIIREKIRKSRYNKHGFSRHIGDTDICAKCGDLYIIVSGRQKYCPECSSKEVRETINTHKRDYMAYRSELNSISKKERHTDRTVCVICGNTFTASNSSVTCSAECAEKYKKQKSKKAYEKYQKNKQRS